MNKGIRRFRPLRERHSKLVLQRRAAKLQRRKEARTRANVLAAGLILPGEGIVLTDA